MPVPTAPDSAALCGVGYTELTRKPDRPEVELGVAACRMAAEDAGIDPAEIEGLCVQVHHYPPPDPAAIARGLGMRDPRWLEEGGPVGMAGVGRATRVIESGRARSLFVCKILNTIAPVNTPDIDPETGEVPGDAQFEVPYGLGYTMQRVALFCRRYMHHYGITAEQAGQVAVVEREHAILHPYAYQKTPIDLDDYLASRWIAEPVRLLDCDIPVNGAQAYLLVAGDRARSLRQPPVWVRGWAEVPNPELFLDHLQPLPGPELAPVAEILYRDTGLGPRDMDLCLPYDGFSYFVPIWLEHLGILPRGDAGAFLEGGDRIRRDGELPINTHGGNLSNGRMHGQGHLLEAVEQLRRSAGVRQIQKPLQHAILSTAFPGSGPAGILAAEL